MDARLTIEQDHGKKLEMGLSELEAQVQEAQQRWNETLQRRTSREDYRAARQAVLQAERALSLEKGEETAVACEWPVRWDKGAPLPHIVASGYKTYLLYIVDVPDPKWDGTYVNVVQTTDTLSIAIVEFLRCESFRFGGPNDEVLTGHPLWGKGLEYYEAHVVANSRWLAEQERINSVHSLYNPNIWKTLKHYLLLFHDETFECLAQDFKVEVVTESMGQAVKMVTERLH